MKMGDRNVQSMLTRLMEEKHTFTYKKLVVPMSMRSPYWKYYGFPATEEGDILTKVKIICTLCKTQLAYNKNTSNLRMHLQNRHPHELMELVSEHPPEIRPSIKALRQGHSHSLHDGRMGSSPSARANKRKMNRSLETSDSGFTKQGNVYITQADGSIEINGNLQFMSDPNISISNYAEDESENSIQILTPTVSHNPNVILVENSNSPNHHQRLSGKNMTEAIAEFIVLDLQNPEIVEGRGFQRLLATLHSPCEIPRKGSLLDAVLPTMQTDVKEHEQAVLKDHDGFVGITMEEWKSVTGECHITVCVHYQHKTEPQLESRVMSTVHCLPPESVDPTEYWMVTVDGLLTEWHIDPNKITAVIVATNRAEVIEALAKKNLLVVPCLTFSLQECAYLLLTLPEIEPILRKCRALLGLVHRHPTAYASLRMQEPVLELEELLISDLPAIWMTTHQMLEQLSLRRSLFPSVLENVDELTPDQRLQMLMSDEEWSVIDDVVTALAPFKVAVLTLSEERFPLLSLLEPLLWQLCSSHLQEKEGDSELTVRLKQTLSDELSARYNDEELRTLLRTSTMLDPRFKTLGYADSEVKEFICKNLQKTLESLIEKDTSLVSLTDASPNPNKKSRLSGMAFLLGGVCDNKAAIAATERAKLEVVQFKSEASAPLDACPLQWWAQSAAKCPHLVHLARRYLSLPSTATPGHRIPLPYATIFYEKRQALPPEIVDTLLFLNGNYGSAL